MEKFVDIPSSGGGLGQGSSSSAGPADEDFTGGGSHFSPWKKVRSARQVVSAQLGGHVSSSTLSAHPMARVGEPVDSDGSIVWVRMHDGDTDQSYYWNRRTLESSWRAPAGVEVVWVGEMSARGSVWYFVLATTDAGVGPGSAEIRRDFAGAVLDKAVGMPLVCRNFGGSAETAHRQVWFTCLLSDTVKVTKVKGHATEVDDVELGRVRLEDVLGKIEADAAADLGSHHQPEEVLDVRRALLNARELWCPVVLHGCHCPGLGQP